ncbi:hypothetical protein NLU13_3635 [Sarocladium strictum]|uniref:Cyclase n=1 Tax=Sarocladium strictum TaxID=5046 RepID=A0AA39LAF6_SARSR|nr:hypothetical protein NLU13_3635 [Sarocladium strictum]
MPLLDISPTPKGGHLGLSGSLRKPSTNTENQEHKAKEDTLSPIIGDMYHTRSSCILNLLSTPSSPDRMARPCRKRTLLSWNHTTMLFDPQSESFPKRTELPKIPGAPEIAAWFWGKDDEHGRLNLLTPDRILKAAQSVQLGHVVPMNLPLNVPGPAMFGRENFEHTVKQIGPGAYDDVFTCNPQSGTQWDGFRHFADPGTQMFYNGVKLEDIEEEGKKTTGCGAQAWAQTGIAGRGVLVDVYSWAKQQYDPHTTHRISVSDIKACAESQGVTFEVGDILLIRCGWVHKYLSLDAAGKEALAEKKTLPEHAYAGLEQSAEMIDFLHDYYFAAAVSDNPMFEAWPPKSFAAKDHCLHAFMLPMWGMPIGELWDLEALSEKCAKEQRYSFFLTSSPDNIPGSVSSRPNAMAIF